MRHFSPPQQEPSLPNDDQLLTSWFSAVGRARRIASWLRVAAWLFGLGAILSLVGMVIAAANASVGLVGAMTVGFTNALTAAIFAAGAALLEVHAARLELAIYESSIGEDDE